MTLLLDDWQREFIECKTDKILVAGRQTGKSEAQAYDAAQFAVDNEGTTTLIISKTERQSQEMIIKVLQFLQEYHPKTIGKGTHKPLKSVIWIRKDGGKWSRVMCQPIGLAAEGIRGYTIHKLVVDEAQLPSQDTYDAVLPMLMTTGGKISLSGTPQGKRGFFWEAFQNKTGLWKVFHVNSEEVVNKRPITESWPEWKKIAALEFQAKMRSIMSDKRYRQEFMAEFIEDLDQVFSDKWIDEVCVLKRPEHVNEQSNYFIGVDVGRSIDPSTFEVIQLKDNDHLLQVENIARRELSIVQTSEMILELNKKYNFNKAGIDGGGMGAGVVDILLTEKGIKSKVIDLNNAKRNVEWADKPDHVKLLKEDMYRYMQVLGERGKLKLLDDGDIKLSLRSCQIEYVEGSKEVRIYGNDTHITEGLIRAVWCTKIRALRIYAA
jgi:hypothetical protein